MWLALAILFVFTECKKKDDVSPTAEITGPDAMTHFDYNDIITVKGKVTDETELKSIKIQLVGLDGSATDFSYEMDAISHTQNFAKSFTLDDRHMISGNYFIKVIATDKADNTKTAYREIIYSELPLALNDIFVITKNSAFTYDLFKVNGSSTQSVYSFTGDFQDMASNSYWEQLMLSGGSNGDLVSFDPVNLAFNWSKSPQNTSVPFFGKMYQKPSDKGVYVAQGNNTAVAYDKSGQKQRTLSFTSTNQANHICEEGDYIIVEENSIGQNVLGVYYKSTGSFKHQLVLNGEVVKMLPKGNGEIYLITKQGTQSYLYIYYVSDNYTYEPHAIPVGNTYDACSVTDDEIFIAHDNGGLKYTYNNNSMINTIPAVANQIEYDYLNDRIVLTSGSNLSFYDRLGNPGGNVSHSGNIEKFVLYYNK